VLDIRLLRKKKCEVEKRLALRGERISLDELLSLDESRRRLLTEVEGLRKERRTGSEAVAQLRKKDADATEKIKGLRSLNEKISQLEKELAKIENQIQEILLGLPNPPHQSVPQGAEELVLREWGEKREFDFTPKNHTELGKLHGILDFQRASRMSGSQFPMYTGEGALLEFALINYFIERNFKKGYRFILPPHLVNAQSELIAGGLPKFGDDLYHIERDDLYLIPTSEVNLANFHAGEILEEKDLPLNYMAYTANFRREAGTYGARERGLIRIHQFNKVELFKFTEPENSFDELERLVADAEDLVQGLGLHYRVTLLPTTEIAFQSAKTYDIEAWLSAQGTYSEVSSCSNCEDFQARRANTRYRTADGKLRFVHTLNGSALATSRLFVAILENYQEPDGSILIPEVLHKYMFGIKRIPPQGS
jgi:seryl-tRNA synthetase